ncbi:unnamed protein product, partial [marine sediment metagenome]
MVYGWAGNILKVNLTKMQFKEVPTTRYSREFLGGKGVNVKILWDNLRPDIDPFDPKNVIMFGTGPLTGTLAPASGRCSVSSKSPLTGFLGSGSFGGFWGPELKFAGYDHLFIEGRSKNPVWLLIDDGKYEIRKAEHLCGKDTIKTQELIENELKDPRVQVICIGQAGEKKVMFASIRSGTFNTCARAGMGAVMGSKNLKAIAVRGSKALHIGEPEKFVNLCHDVRKKFLESPYLCPST